MRLYEEENRVDSFVRFCGERNSDRHPRGDGVAVKRPHLVRYMDAGVMDLTFLRSNRVNHDHVPYDKK